MKRWNKSISKHLHRASDRSEATDEAIFVEFIDLEANIRRASDVVNLCDNTMITVLASTFRVKGNDYGMRRR